MQVCPGRLRGCVLVTVQLTRRRFWNRMLMPDKNWQDVLVWYILITLVHGGSASGVRGGPHHATHHPLRLVPGGCPDGRHSSRRGRGEDANLPSYFGPPVLVGFL